MNIKYIAYSFVTIYFLILLYYIVSLYLIVYELPINDIIKFINHLNNTFDIDGIVNNTISAFRTDINYFKTNIEKFQSINQTLYPMFTNFNNRLISIENDVNIIKDNTNPNIN